MIIKFDALNPAIRSMKREYKKERGYSLTLGPFDHAVLEQFDLARIWREDKATGRWTRTDKFQSSVPPEILFVERCTQFLKEGGRMGIVLPDNILGAPGLGYVREWIVAHHRVVASVDLHADTFQSDDGYACRS